MKNSSPNLERYVIPDMPSTEELTPYLQQIEAGRWYSNFGPLVLQFEERLLSLLNAADNGGRRGKIAHTSMITCFHALQIGLELFRLPPQASVLIPAVTFPACPLAVRHAGAVPVLADVDPESWELTPQTARRVAEKMSIQAVMPVAVYGVPVPAEEWDKFTEDTGIPVIIDAAAALESQAIPSKALVACSLHATKPFSVGEGGVLISRNRAQIEEARCKSNFGTVLRIAECDGMNAKMSEFHAAVGLAQLDRWAGIKKRRRRAFEIYNAALKKAGLGLTLQKGSDQTILGALMLESRDYPAQAIVESLNAQNIAAHRMYLPPLYYHPHFAGLTVVDTEGKTRSGQASRQQKAALMVNAERMQRSVFGVPFHAFLTEADVAMLIGRLTQVLDTPRKAKSALG